MADAIFVVKNGLTVNNNFVANSTQISLGTINASNGVLLTMTSITVGNGVVNSVINSTSFNGVANNTLFVGSLPVNNVVSNAQLTANLSNYQTTAGMSAYQTTAGLSANVASYLTAYTGNVNAASFTVGANFVANSTGVYDTIGYVRNVPVNSQSAAYVLVASDNGKFIDITSGGVTVPASIFSVGQSVTVYNDSTANQTITQGSGVTMYEVGTSTTGNRTLAQRGLATIFCVGANTFVITGGGLS